MHLSLRSKLTALLVVGLACKSNGEMTEKEVFAAQKDRVVVVEALNEFGQRTIQGSGVILGATQQPAVFVGSDKPIQGCDIVTNAHVVDHAGLVLIRTFDKRIAHGEVIYFDRESDIAIIRSPFTPAVQEVQIADKVEIGDKTIAIGSPKGLDWSLSVGIVSRIPSDKANVVQTSAPISAGSSGGGLFNSDGKLIGITTSAIRDGQNLNFAARIDEKLFKLIARYRKTESRHIELFEEEMAIGHREPFFCSEREKKIFEFTFGDNDPRVGLWLATKWESESAVRASRYSRWSYKLNDLQTVFKTVQSLRNAGVNISREQEINLTSDASFSAGGPMSVDMWATAKSRVIAFYSQAYKEFPDDLNATLGYIREVAEPKDRIALLKAAEKKWPTKIEIAVCARVALGRDERSVDFLRAFESRIPISIPEIHVTEPGSKAALQNFRGRFKLAIDIATTRYVLERIIQQELRIPGAEILKKREW